MSALGNIQQVIHTLSYLSRLTEINAQLGEDRKSTIQKIERIWIDVDHAIREKTDLALIRSQAFEQFRDINMHTLYPTLPAIEEYDALSQLTATSLRELVEIPAPPILKSNKGCEGPTLLASFIDHSHLEEYVLKWVPRLELSCNRLYQCLSQCDSNCSHSFEVPKSAGLDFKTEPFIHELIDGTKIPLSIGDQKTLTGSLEKILQIIHPLIHGVPPIKFKKRIMLSERVNAANLLDFALTTFNPKNTEQNIKLFERLGCLAFLDILMGQFDRFVPIDFYDEAKHYSFTQNVANLGNVLITSDYHLVAIDNGLFFGEPEFNEHYLVFLKNLFSEPEFFKRIAKTMFRAIRDSFDQEDRKTELQPFMQFYDEFAENSFSIGIRKMHEHFMVNHLSKIEFIFSELKDKVPEDLIKVVQKRFATLVR